MCYWFHTFLLPLKSTSIPCVNSLYIPIYSGAHIMKTKHSAIQIYLYIYHRTHFTMACAFTWLFSALMTISGYAFIPLVPTVFVQYLYMMDVLEIIGKWTHLITPLYRSLGWLYVANHIWLIKAKTALTPWPQTAFQTSQLLHFTLSKIQWQWTTQLSWTFSLYFAQAVLICHKCLFSYSFGWLTPSILQFPTQLSSLFL